jgi:hypothetical protein
MISNNLYKLALIIIFVLVIIQIFALLNNGQENMVTDLAIHQFQSVSPKPFMPPQIDFYYKQNRYSRPNNVEPELIDPLSMTNGNMPCTGQADKDVYLTPGANNVYGDVLWGQTSGKMILENNCLDCNEFGKNSVMNAPTGISSPMLNGYENNLVTGALSDQVMPWGGDGAEINNGDGMVGGLGSGLPPLESYRRGFN